MQYLRSLPIGQGYTAWDLAEDLEGFIVKYVNENIYNRRYAYTGGEEGNGECVVAGARLAVKRTEIRERHVFSPSSSAFALSFRHGRAEAKRHFQIGSSQS